MSPCCLNPLELGFQSESDKRQKVTKEPNPPHGALWESSPHFLVNGVNSEHLGSLLFWLQSARWREVACATLVCDRIAQEGTLRPESSFF